MAATLQHRFTATSSQGSSVNSRQTTAQTVTAGNLLVAKMYHQDSGVPTMSHNTGSITWHQALAPTNAGSGVNYFSIYYAYNIGGTLTSLQVTATWGVSAAFSNLIVEEWSGFGSTDPLVGGGTATGSNTTGATASTGSITLTSQSLIEFVAEDDNGTGVFTTDAGGYTVTANADNYFGDGYHVANASEVARCTVTAGTWRIAAAAFVVGAVPTTPNTPSPSDAATGTSISPTLTWSAALATTYDVYFGTAASPPLVSSGQVPASYTPSTLANATTYYWKIVAINALGSTTGPIWSFVTAVYAPPTMFVEMEFTGVGGGWTDVTGDVVSSQSPLSFTYGIRGSSPLDRVADVGELTFSLNNDTTNSGAKLGYYSPLNTNVRTGFTWGIGVRVRFVFSGTTYYKWKGKISEIDPVPGIKRERTTYIRCVDWMIEATEFVAREVTMQVSKRSDEVFSAMLASITRQPRATSIQNGVDTYSYSLDNLGDHTAAVTIFQQVAMSELGWIYIKGDTTGGETLVFENRNSRTVAGPTNAFNLNNNMVEMSVPRTLDLLLNRVDAIVHPKRVDAAATTVLFAQQASTPTSIGASETLTIWADYRDPTQTAAALIGGTAQVAPVATTDYTMNSAADGSGTDLTGNFTVTATAFAATVKFVIVNSGAAGYITKLQIRGKGIYDFGPQTCRSEDTMSQSSYGLKSMDIDMPYQNSTTNGKLAADFFLALYKSPTLFVESVRFFCGTSALSLAALAREIGDRVGIDETVTGVTKTIPASSSEQGFYVQSVSFDVVPSKSGILIWCKWGLVPADSGTYWILGTAGKSELGDTTWLGFL